MKHVLRAATAVAVIATSAAVAGTAVGRPAAELRPGDRRQYNAANSSRRSGTSRSTSARAAAACRRSDAAAVYLEGVLRKLGFDATVSRYAPAHRAAAKLTSTNATLFNGPNWQFSSSTNAQDDRRRDPVTAPGAC